MKLVLVRWRDAWFDDFLPESEWAATYEVQTVGWIVRETDDTLSIAAEVLPNEDGFRAVTHIPREVIQTVQILSVNLTTLEVVS